MYLKRFAIRHIKCFETLELDFFEGNKPRKWNVILGENGTGKSTLLQAIAVTLAGPEAIKQLLPRPEGWVQVGQERGMLETVVLHGEHDGSFTMVPDRPPHFSPQEPLCPREVRYVVTGDKPTEVGKRYFDTPAFVEQDGEDFDYLTRTLYSERGREVQGWLACGYGPFRRLSGGSEQGREVVTSSSKSARYATLFLEGAALTECEDWLMKLDHQAKDGNTLSAQRLKWAKHALESNLLPEQVSLKVSSSGVFFHSHGHSIPIVQLSDGYRSMLALAIDLVRWLTVAFPNAPEPLKQEGVVLIDEIDAHLHPSWQRQIGPWLQEKFPGLQFIVATHSPFVAQAASEGGIIVLKWAAGERTVEPYTDIKSVRGWQVNQIYTSVLFDLPTTLIPEIEAKLEELDELEGKSVLNAEEQIKRDKLHRELETLLLPPGETKRERDTYERLQQLVLRAEKVLAQWPSSPVNKTETMDNRGQG
jgi:energy-coupling factor transporter ATP-binding protein EcfA2